MRYLGLKIWSTNTVLRATIERLCKDGLVDFIELFVVPGSSGEHLEKWDIEGISYVLHAPHSYTGLNFSLKENEHNNNALIEEVDIFRKILNPQKIVFHSGVNGVLSETIRQIICFKKIYPRLFDVSVIENKPKVGLKQEYCVGASPEEIDKIITETGIGFCLDISHAAYYARWAGSNYKSVLDDFLKLKPDMYHVSDGNIHSVVDSHLNYGAGNFDLYWIIQRIPDSAFVTIETPKNINGDLREHKKDVLYFRAAERALNQSALKLREVCESDSELLWKWANDADARRLSFNPKFISLNEHTRWFSEKLKDPNCFHFLAVSKKGIPVGQIRFDIKNGIADVSVSVDENQRRKGYGSELIRSGIKNMISKNTFRYFRAFVKIENTSSIKAFDNAGFVNNGAELIKGSKALNMIRGNI